MNDLPDVNDLAYVLRACCDAALSDNGGAIVMITAIFTIGWTCRDCGYHEPEPITQYVGCQPDFCLPLSWLKRIPGLDELSAVDIVAELGAERPKRVRVSV